jgi:hypothetical protein
MLDLFLGLRQVFEGGAQDKEEIAGSQPPFRDFLDLGLCNEHGDVIPWVYPCLGLIL